VKRYFIVLKNSKNEKVGVLRKNYRNRWEVGKYKDRHNGTNYYIETDNEDDVERYAKRIKYIEDKVIPKFRERTVFNGWHSDWRRRRVGYLYKTLGLRKNAKITLELEETVQNVIEEPSRDADYTIDVPSSYSKETYHIWFKEGVLARKYEVRGFTSRNAVHLFKLKIRKSSGKEDRVVIQGTTGSQTYLMHKDGYNPTSLTYEKIAELNEQVLWNCSGIEELLVSYKDEEVIDG
jgi:hypothetical protein